MSLSGRANALWPICSGSAAVVKWIPSTTASVLNSTQRSASPRSITAQSSPAPTTVLSLAGSDRVRRAMRSNSFIGGALSLESFSPLPFPEVNQKNDHGATGEQRSKSNDHPVPVQILNDDSQEIGRVEQAVGEDRRQQIVSCVVNPGQHQAQEGQRNERHQIQMQRDDKNGGAPQRQPGITPLFE